MRILYICIIKLKSMKKIVLIVKYIFLSIVLSAQTLTEPVYLILSAKTTEGDGIVQVIGKMNSLRKTPTILYFLTTKSKQIELIFQHFDFNAKELAKVRKVRDDDQMEALAKSVSFLKTISPIDLDVLFPTWTKAQAEAFRDSLHGKTVYIIDRNDIKKDTVKLIQVSCLKPLSF